MELAKKKCVPCEKGAAPLKGASLKSFMERVENWNLVEESEIEKEYRFKNFKEALEFVNDIGRVAEEEGHHPDIFLTWGKVKLSYSTHKIKGLTESDFIMAAKSDGCFVSRFRKRI